MSCIREAMGACKVASQYNKPIWVSFTINDDPRGRLRSGESIIDAVAAIKDTQNLQAILINCSSTDATSIAIPQMRKMLD